MSINSFKDPWRTKYSLQGSCQKIDSFQDPSKFIHSFPGSCRDLTWNLAFPKILDGIHVFAKTLKVPLKMMHHFWSYLKDLGRTLHRFRFRKSRERSQNYLFIHSSLKSWPSKFSAKGNKPGMAHYGMRPSSSKYSRTEFNLLFEKNCISVYVLV